MPRDIRTILIDPKMKIVSEVMIGHELQDIYEQLGIDTFCTVRVGQSDWIYLDDIGRYADVQHYFMFSEYPEPLTNRALIMGDGESTTFTLEEATQMTAFAV